MATPSPGEAHRPRLNEVRRIGAGVIARVPSTQPLNAGHLIDLMLTSFSSEDLGRAFDPHTLTKGRSLVFLGAVEVTLADSSITGVVDHVGHRRSAKITPSLL